MIDLFSTYPSRPISYGYLAILGLMLVLLALCIWGYRRATRTTKPEPNRQTPPTDERMARWFGLRDLAPWQKTGLTLVMAVFGALFVLALFAITRILIETIFPFVTNDKTAVSLGLGTMFVALLGAPFVIWRSVVAQKTLDANMHGQVTDRINKAVEGLGAEKVIKKSGENESIPNMEVRIGSILALERIAKENLDFHIQVMEILCAYVRENSHLRNASESPSAQLAETIKGERSTTVDEAALKIRRLLSLSDDTWDWKTGLQEVNDIQIAISVMGRRSAAQISVEKNIKPYFTFNLRNTSLLGTDFSGLELGGFDLRGANLIGSIFKKTHATSTDFRGGIMHLCEFDGTRLGLGKKFSGAELWGSSFRNTDLSKVEMHKDHFESTFGDASNDLPMVNKPLSWMNTWQEREKIGAGIFRDAWKDWCSTELSEP